MPPNGESSLVSYNSVNLYLLELKLHTLHGGLGDESPAAPRLGDGHGGGAGQGRLPQHEAHVERLQHVLVALLGHAGVGARHLHHLAAGVKAGGGVRSCCRSVARRTQDKPR